MAESPSTAYRPGIRILRRCLVPSPPIVSLSQIACENVLTGTVGRAVPSTMLTANGHHT